MYLDKKIKAVEAELDKLYKLRGPIDDDPETKHWQNVQTFSERFAHEDAYYEKDYEDFYDD